MANAALGVNHAVPERLGHCLVISLFVARLAYLVVYCAGNKPVIGKNGIQHEPGRGRQNPILPKHSAKTP